MQWPGDPLNLDADVMLCEHEGFEARRRRWAGVGETEVDGSRWRDWCVVCS